MSSIKIIAHAALDGLRKKAEEMASDAGEAVTDALKDAAKHGQELIELRVKGQISTEELKAALNEVKETVEAAIAGKVFDDQREAFDFLKKTALDALPLIIAAV